MGSSLRAALRALAVADAGAAVIALADQPLVGPEAVARLIAAYRAAPPWRSPPTRASPATPFCWPASTGPR